MKLNIYIISNPISELLSNSIYRIKDNKYSQYSDKYKYISLFLIYEIFRKYLKIQKVYIKYAYSIKDLYTTYPKKKNFILTNISQTYKMLTDVTNIIPNIEIINIEYNKINELSIIEAENIINMYHNPNILILEEILNSESTIKLLKYLDKKTSISLEEINIACIGCYHEILNKINNIYPQLKIYTTQIIYNSYK